jgi:LysM domain
VVGGAVVVAAVATCMVLLSLGGGALAASHGAGRAANQGMRHLIVEPGQTLWSIAVTAEPDADPRVTIQQIMQSNSLTGSTVYAGERLWVPAH